MTVEQQALERLVLCPVCGGGVKFTRGWTWIDWQKYAGEHVLEPSICKCVEGICPVCYPCTDNQPYGLLWVGEASYTPQSFIQEALVMGESRRIAGVPKYLKLSWVLFAHKSACGRRRPPFATVVTPPLEEESIPGVFYAFRPTSLELLVWESEAKPEYLEDLAKRNITAVIIPVMKTMTQTQRLK